MNFTTLKLMLAALFGFALMGLSQITYAGWDSGDCSSVSGSAPCIEYQDTNGDWYHFNGQGGHSGDPHETPQAATPSSVDFQFCNEEDENLVTLTCENRGSFDCNLCLDGEVKKFQDNNNNWRVGIRVTGGQPYPGEEGDSACNDIEAHSYPWYAHENSQHSGYGMTSGILYNGGGSTYTGSIGLIDITYHTIIPVSLVDDGHLHDVVFANADSSFDFDGTLYEDGSSHSDTGCSIDGTLFLNNGEDLNVL